MHLKPAALLLAFCGIAPLALADETVSLSDTPPAVQKTIQVQVSDGKIGDITKDSDDEETVYDVDLTAKDGSERDFTVAQDGTLLSTEVALGETPAVVQKTIQTELNGGSLDSIDKNLADVDVSYDVEGTGKDGKEKNFTVDADGKLSSLTIALSETSDPVQKTIAAHLNGGKVTGIDENFGEDGTDFDVEVTATDGAKKSFNVAADGTLASEQVPFANLPPRARAAIKEHLGGGTVVRVDKSFEKRDNTFPFEVEGRKDGKPFDFSVAPRGKFLGMDD